MTLTDTELREALAPLRGDSPTDAEVAAVLAATSSRARPTRNRGWRVSFAIAAASLVVAVTLAALPGTPAERGGEPATASSILHAAAAVAADQRPTAFTGYRYTEWIEHWRWDNIESPVADGSAPLEPAAPGNPAPAPVADSEAPTPEPAATPVVEIEQRIETWVDRNWHGRIEAQPARVIQGGEAARRYAGQSGKYQYGEGRPRPDIGELPTEPNALREALLANARSQDSAPGFPTPDELHYSLLRDVVFMLGDTNTTPPLRAALFGVLALMPGVEPAPEAKDALGRTGQAVRIPTRRAEGAITVIFDPNTSQMLYWSEIGSGGPTPDQEHTIVHAGQVKAIGERP